MPEPGSLERAVRVTSELVGLGIMLLLLWQYLDPDADPKAALVAARDKAGEWLDRRGSIVRTLADIRDLPESEETSD